MLTLKMYDKKEIELRFLLKQIIIVANFQIFVIVRTDQINLLLFEIVEIDRIKC